MVSSFKTVKDLLLRNYPDSSGLAFIASTTRARAYLQEFAHREVGGILPSFKSFDEYKSEEISQRLKLKQLKRGEDLIYLSIFLGNQGAKYEKEAGYMAFAMLPAIRYACSFSITRDEMKNLKGIREEHVARIDELFNVMESFGAWLKDYGLFMSELCEHELLHHAPTESEFFVNLPLLTPVNESFFKKIPAERKLVDTPAYAEAFLRTSPAYASSRTLLQKAGVALRSASTEELSLFELQGKASIPRYLRREIGDFLGKGNRNGQMFIILLDENLSFYLWQTVFKDLKHLVNFSVGLPLSVSPVGVKLAHFFKTIGENGSKENFKNFKEQLASELYQNWNAYVKEDLYSIEAAIDLLDGLEQYYGMLGRSFSQVANLLLQGRQFFIEGDRTAPVQLVGLGDATGIPYEHGIVLPVNSDVFPSKIYNGPFLNFVHTPQIRDAHLEMEDLALRQFMSFGRHVDVVSVFDEARNMTPSFFYTFLKNEFGGTTKKCSIEMRPPCSKCPKPFVENSDEIRERVLSHAFSFSSLSSLLTCPYGFYYDFILKASVPEIMQDEEKISQILGTFVHRFFKSMAAEETPLETWRPLFEKLWTESPDIARIEGNEIFRMFVASYLNSLVEHENEDERSLLFGPGTRSAEKAIEAGFGNGMKFRMTGRIDSIVERDNTHTIIDFKYKKNPDLSKKPLADILGNGNQFDPRFQIVIYSHLLMETENISADRIRGFFVYVREEESKKRFQRIDEVEIIQAKTTLEILGERIEEILSLERFEPNYKSRTCPYCLLKSLCKADNFYRKSF